MKTMTCKQLGGACEEKFSADSFQEIATMSKKHGQEMFAQKDPAHLEAMEKMRELMQNPEALEEWISDREQEFESLPEDE